MNLNRKKGVTLIESLIAVGIITSLSVYSSTYLKDYFEEEKMNRMANKITSIISGFDYRFYLDGYDGGLWTYGTNYNINDEVFEIIQKSLVSTYNTSCGLAGGWIPQNDAQKQKALLDCSDIDYNPYSFNHSLDVFVDSAGYMSKVDLYVGVPSTLDTDDFDQSFSALLNIKSKLKTKSNKTISGVLDYYFVSNEDVTKKITLTDCINDSKKCLIKSSWSRDGETEQLRTTGTNSLVNDSVSFRIEPHNDRLLCDVWDYDPATSQYTLSLGSQYCGIGIYEKTEPTPFVKINLESTNVDFGVHLDSECKDYEDNGSGELIESGLVPCGMFIDPNGATKVVTLSNDLKANDANVDNLISTEGYFEHLDVQTILKVLGDTGLQTLEVNGVSEFLKSVTIKESLIVENNLKVEDLTVNTLTNKSFATFKDDVQMNKNLEVKGQLNAPHIISTLNVKNGDNCNTDEANSMAIDKDDGVLLICKTSPRLNRYTWQTNSVGEISPFNGNCPEGWREISEAEGRFLSGTGAIINDLGIIENYVLGQGGGLSAPQLTEENLPAHNHSTKNLDHGLLIPNGEKEALGGAEFAANTNYLDNNLNGHDKVLESGATGAGKRFENRPSYYAVKWCLSEDPSETNSDVKTPTGNTPWFDYIPEISPWFDSGAKFDCTVEKEEQLENPTTGIVERVRTKTCKQKQTRTIQPREIQYAQDGTTFIIRDKGSATVEERTIDVVEAWIEYPPDIGPWTDFGLPFNCANDDEVVYIGGVPHLKRTCDQWEERYIQLREIEIGTNEIRNDGDPIRETRVVRKPVYQEITPTHVTCSPWVLKSYTSNWTPNLDHYYARDSIRQTRGSRYERVCDYYGTLETGEHILYKSETEVDLREEERFMPGNIIVAYLNDVTVKEPPYKVESNMTMRIRLDAPVPNNGKSYTISFYTQQAVAKEYNPEQDSNIGRDGEVRSSTYFTGGDIDSWMKTPCGSWISYINKSRGCNGKTGVLDVDDTSGGRGENITWPNGAPQGYYTFCLHNYRGSGRVQWTKFYYGSELYQILSPFTVTGGTSSGCSGGRGTLIRHQYFDPNTKFDRYDYMKKTGSVTFTSGNSYKDVPITLLGGPGGEGNEHFYFNITENSSLIELSDPLGKITITP